MSTPNPSDGWCPFATHYPTTKYWAGNQGRRAVVMHIAQGSYEGAVSWLSNAGSNPNSSAHFVIAKDGRIAQLVSIWDSAWANGLRWINGKWYTPADPPRLENPPWADIVAGVNPNLYTISVEHEGYYQDPWTPQMYAANTQLLKWIGAQLGQPGAPITWIAHRNLIGHYEIDPIDRANCPGPTVNFAQMAIDANANTADLFSQIKPQSISAHVYGTTALVSLPGYTVVSQLTDVDIPVAGYLDYQGTRWYISQYSYQNHVLNFFDSAVTQPPEQDLKMSLCLNPGYRDTVTPSVDELGGLGPQWLRVLLFSQYQNMQTGQNTELDWLLSRASGLGIKVLALVNTETLGQMPPAHGSGWGDANTGYIGQVASLCSKVAGYYKNQIGAIEVFNEPDVQGIVPEDYGAMLKAAYPQIKAVSQLPVISAGICCGENIDYLRRVATVARGSFDYAGWHAYGERVDGYPFAAFGFGELRNSLSSARTIAGKPLWVTEIGAQLDWTWQPGVNSADAVAAYLTQAYNLMLTLGCNTVTEAFWFTYKISGESWGLVDDAGNHRPAWNAFQQAAGVPPPPAPPAMTAGSLSPTTVTAGDRVNINVTIKNSSNTTLATQGPDPGFVYNEGETFVSRGFPAVGNAFRVGLDFEGRTGTDHPFRWGLGAPLAPGQSATITGAVRLTNPATGNYWFGLVQEQVAWIQDNYGKTGITVVPSSPVPVGTQPVITGVTIGPASLDSGATLNITIVVRNDSNETLQTQGPDPAFAYNETDNFTSLGFKEVQGMFRVGIDFDGRSGIDHPYRWGLGSPLAPGQSSVITGTIKLTSVGTRRYWAGLVQEQVQWIQDNQGATQVTVSPGIQPPPQTGQPTIAGVTIRPTSLNQGELLYVSVTVTNNSSATLQTQGPPPGFIYNEGDNYFTKQNPPVSGAYRIGLDYEGRTGVDHPYRWGFNGPLAPGQSTTVSGYVRLNRRQSVNYWVALIQEATAVVQDNQGITQITVNKA